MLPSNSAHFSASNEPYGSPRLSAAIPFSPEKPLKIRILRWWKLRRFDQNHWNQPSKTFQMQQNVKTSFKANFVETSPTHIGITYAFKIFHDFSKILPWTNQAKIFISSDSAWFTESFEMFASLFYLSRKKLASRNST